MAIPDYQTLMLPLLDCLRDGAEHQLNNVYELLCEEFKLTQEERKAVLPSGSQGIMRNRVGWARTYLKKAGLLLYPKRGIMQITDKGQKVLAENPEKIDNAFLDQFPEFVYFRTGQYPGSEENEQSEKTQELFELINQYDKQTGSLNTPEERIESAHQSLVQTLISDLLDNIKSNSPSFFEHLVVDLMLAMGYGGSREEAGKATQSTHDDGIDGIINEDKLGLDCIYLQAKRWENVVQRPEIDKFIGALHRKGATKGVFITTSSFSQGAKAAIEGLAMRIVLIDGVQLAELMIKHNLGVSIKNTYEIKQVDSDYFNEE